MVDQKNSEVTAAVFRRIFPMVKVIGVTCGPLSAVTDTTAVGVIVVRFTEGTAESLTDQMTLFVVMDQAIVDSGVRYPLRIYDTII